MERGIGSLYVLPDGSLDASDVVPSAGPSAGLLTVRHKVTYCIIVISGSLALLHGEEHGERDRAAGSSSGETVAAVEALTPAMASASFDNPRPTARLRIIDAMLACLARQGLGKTTLDDVARQARCSRATLYRIFPGGKDSVLEAAVDTEVARSLSALAVVMGQASDLESLLVMGMAEASRLFGNNEVLRRLLELEPEVLLPRLTFREMDRILVTASAFLAPFLARWLAPVEAERIAEWATRIVVSYLLCPSEAVDLADEDQLLELVRSFVMPAVAIMQQSSYPAGSDRVKTPSRTDPSRTDFVQPAET